MKEPEQQEHSVDPRELMTLEELQVLSHNRWLSICMQFCEEVGFTVVTSDKERFPSGVHFGLRLKDHPAILSYVSSAPDRDRVVTRQEVLDLIKKAEEANVPNCALFAANRFTIEVWQLTDDYSIDLINYKELISKTRLLSSESRQLLKEIATRWEFIYPYCPLCGEKMSLINAFGGKYWKCDNSLSCSMTITC